MSEAFSRAGVIGCGLMGSGIAECLVRSGLEVAVVEIGDEALEAGRLRIERSLAAAVGAGKLGESERDAAMGRLVFATELEALADVDLAVEAVIEAEEEKVRIFTALDRIVESPSAVLASNTSSIPIMKLAMATGRPGSVLGLHFFNPAPVMALVELVTQLLTDPEVADRVESFAESVLHKHVIRSQDRAGFIVNALLIPYLLSAIRMLESGFASAHGIDTGMVQGCRHPMGPLALADLIGLDTLLAIAESLYEEFKDPQHALPPLLSRMVDAGLLGRKAGRGFYDYPQVSAS